MSKGRACLLAPRGVPGGTGKQPQRDVFWLYRLPHYGHQLGVQRVQVRLVAKPGRELFQSPPGVVLAAVEAPVDKGLNASSQRVEQGRYRERGDDHSELGLLLLAGQRPEEGLGRRDATEVHQRERAGERAVDEGAVYDDIYPVEPVAEDGYAHGYWQAHEADQAQHESGSVQPPRAGRVRDAAGEDGAAYKHHDHVGEPLDLLALDPARVPEAHHHR